MQALRPGLDAVHDVTIAYHNYKDGGPPSEKTMLAGIPTNFQVIESYCLQRLVQHVVVRMWSVVKDEDGSIKRQNSSFNSKLHNAKQSVAQLDRLTGWLIL